MGGSWSETAPAWADKRYIWTKSVITYTNGDTAETAPVCVTGGKGDTGATGAAGPKGDTGATGPKGETGAAGVGVQGIANYYLATSASSGVTSSTSGWTTAVQSVTASKKYLWNYEVVTYTDGSTAATVPCVIGAYGDRGATGAKGATGATGKGIASIVEHYAVSTSNGTAPRPGAIRCPS